MAPRCVKRRYRKKRTSEPVGATCRINCPISRSPICPRSPSTISNFVFNADEESYGEYFEEPVTILSPCEYIRKWLQRQRFLPQDLSDDFLLFFLTACDYSVELAIDKLQKYFLSRQNPSPLYRDRDPTSPENVNTFNKLYVVPMPDTTPDGLKVIITGAVESFLNYNQLDHAKVLAMVFDLLIWEKDFGFGDYVIVLDGRGFLCPQLLENKVRNHRSFRSLLQDTIPGRLRSFYFLYPPPHVEKIADSLNGLWFTVVKSKEQLITHLPANCLPLEFGGNLGHLGDLLEQWDHHMIQNREFFVEFEKRMVRFYERRICYEEEIRQRGRNWVQNMKLVEDEWEYKKKYYERMRNTTPLQHPAFGSKRLLNMRSGKATLVEAHISRSPCKTTDSGFSGLPSEEDRYPIIHLPEPVKKESGKCIVLPVLELRTFCS